jgi:hypothetical protein
MLLVEALSRRTLQQIEQGMGMATIDASPLAVERLKGSVGAKLGATRPQPNGQDAGACQEQNEGAWALWCQQA